MQRHHDVALPHDKDISTDLQGELEKAPKHGVVPDCGLIASESRHIRGFSGEWREAVPKFCLLLAGHSRIEGGGRTCFLNPDSLFHIPAGQAYVQVDLPGSPVISFCVHYRSDLLPAALVSQLNALGMLSLNLAGINPSHARVLRSIFQEMLFEQSACQESWEMILRSRLVELAVRALRLVRRRGPKDSPKFESGSESTERVARYALSLKSSFLHQETMSEAAAAVGLKERQFTDLFRKVTGQSRHQYLLGLRLNHAAELLVETDRPVMTVAFESGFDDLSYFNHRFKDAYGRSPLAYREQRQVRLPEKAQMAARAGRGGSESTGFKFRGIKGWFWTPEQYLEEIPVLADLKMNFLMNCHGSMMTIQAGGACNEWWKPMPEAKKDLYAKIIRNCRESGITFCFAMHPQDASARPMVLESAADMEQFYQHYDWAQRQQAQWFSVCLYDGSTEGGDAEAVGLSHARFVNAVFGRLRAAEASAQFIVYPAVSWGDAASREHRAYLGALAREMHPDVYVFWAGDGMRTPRVTRIAAESFKKAVNHRLFLWDNYPVNDGNPTLHLGPVSGRDPDLCEVIDGYLSNPMHTQNQINRIPLATCADYAFDPWNYNAARSIRQSILRMGKTAEQQRVLKDLVEAYPGFIVAGGASATNPVRGKLDKLMADHDSRSKAQSFIQHIEDIHARLGKHFPDSFAATAGTIAEDIRWLKSRVG